MSAPHWSRVRAGHWYCRRYNQDTRTIDQIHCRIYTVGPGKDDWELKINGQHAGYFGRLTDAKARVATLYPHLYL